ncbi:MAG: putative coat protein A [Inoviridae sp.]|nr:MAG: putative coat protein A [Inoviridae sp.]
MRFFKYLVFIFFLSYSVSVFSANLNTNSDGSGSSFSSCSDYVSKKGGADFYSMILLDESITSSYHKCHITYKLTAGNSPQNSYATLFIVAKFCASATQVNLKVPVNAQKYQCVDSCQYALNGCVDIDFEAGMTCRAISTGVECGKAPPVSPAKPDDPKKPDAPGDTPAAPGQNSSNTNKNTATSTGTSTSTSTSTTTTNSSNNTSTTNINTTTTNNTTTSIDLSSVESAIESVGKILGSKLDAIKQAIKDATSGGESGGENGSENAGTDLTETNKKLDDIKNNGDKTNNWLQGKNEDGTGGGVGDNPFGTDKTPERVLTERTFDSNIFQSNAQCPVDKTLSFNLIGGKAFSYTFSFAMWCQKLAFIGSLILIAAYAFAAYIVVSKS